jgi:hypothetical protein
MKARFLFPYWSRYLGYACILAHVPIMALSPNGFQHRPHTVPEDPALFNSDHLFFIGTALLMLTGLFLVAFSKEKIEDEQISRLRLDSLQWAIFFNYVLLIITLVFTNRMNFRDILELNLWIPLLFFVIRFRWAIFRLNQSMN